MPISTIRLRLRSRVESRDQLRRPTQPRRPDRVADRIANARSRARIATMFYAIRHVTRYRYSRPVWQSIMEVRMHPRTDQAQRCFTFQLSVNPRARIFSFIDHLGNHVHHFDLPAHHRALTIVADALVNLDPPDAAALGAAVRSVGRARPADRGRRPLADADAEPLRAHVAAARGPGARARRRRAGRPRSADAASATSPTASTARSST